jgi:hypothetical protein
MNQQHGLGSFMATSSRDDPSRPLLARLLALLVASGCGGGTPSPLDEVSQERARDGADGSRATAGESAADPSSDAGSGGVGRAGSSPAGGASSVVPGAASSGAAERGGAAGSDSGRAGSEGGRAGSDDGAGGRGTAEASGGAAVAGKPSGGQAGSVTSGGMGGSPINTVKGLPCDVREVLEERCQTCHQDPPLNDAPMPLLTWYDVSNKATDMQDKLDMDEMPPRGEPDLSERQRTTLLNYLAQGTPPAVNVSCR